MKPAHVWSAFGVCVALLAAALFWTSASVLRLERSEMAARAQAELEENTRLALWRLDSTLMPLLNREGGYAAAECPGGVRTIRSGPARAELAARLPPEPPPSAAPPPALGSIASASAPSESFKNVKEYQARAQTFQKANTLALPRPVASPPPPSEREGPLTALWIGGDLVLARRVGVGQAVHVRGCWQDWPALRSELLASIEDLLPGARLEPAVAAARPDEERRLATVPVKLVPGAIAAPLPSGLSPERVSLAAVWACALLAAVAVGVLLRGVMDLSERRRVFVSAVTHELRTPLTTFRLYADMLAEGMVTSQEKRDEYVERLRAESGRLGHLVENVLFYSRVESGRGAAAQQEVDLGAALLEMRPRLAESAARADLELACATVPDRPAIVRVDRSALEQILLNLVDNAGKYAADSDPPRIDLELSAQDGRAAIRVRDHGPGLSAAGRRRLFRPFSKSDRDAADSAPGIGLGLALSRRLARAQGGDLSLESSGPEGAAFVLTLPLVRSR